MSLENTDKQNSRLFRLLLVSIAFIALLPSSIFAHGGGLDSNGGHNNRKTGGYHCHRCPCGCSVETNKSIDSSTPMRDRPKSGAVETNNSFNSSTPKRDLHKSGNEKSTKTISQSKFYLCERVVDGDTIIIDNNEKVRLIGVDTPETVHPNKPVEFFGKEASAFTKRMVEGKKVRLEYDWEKKDKYGRTLAYVYLDDGTFLNAEIIKQGYGFAYTKFPFKYLEEFRQYEMEAIENRKGLWEQ